MKFPVFQQSQLSIVRWVGSLALVASVSGCGWLYEEAVEEIVESAFPIEEYNEAWPTISRQCEAEEYADPGEWMYPNGTNIITFRSTDGTDLVFGRTAEFGNAPTDASRQVPDVQTADPDEIACEVDYSERWYNAELDIRFRGTASEQRPNQPASEHEIKITTATLIGETWVIGEHFIYRNSPAAENWINAMTTLESATIGRTQFTGVRVATNSRYRDSLTGELTPPDPSLAEAGRIDKIFIAPNNGIVQLEFANGKVYVRTDLL